MSAVGVIDYGVGNLYSVICALERIGGNASLVSNRAEIEQVDHLVLPGVGAFAKGMEELLKRQLIDPIMAHVEKGKPLLGICLGMQLLFDSGKEHEFTEGLGIIGGSVIAIPTTGADGKSHRIPHVGWNELNPPPLAPEDRWTAPLLDGVEPRDSVYFANSYHARCNDPETLISCCHYNGRILTAAVKLGQTYGVQFHPEKSGPVGLKIIENFLKIQPSQI